MTDTPEALVRRFLAAMELRDLAGARAMLAPGFEMVFPGGRRMTGLEELLAWAGPRYRFVHKSFERFDCTGNIVYAIGTLSGEWPDGTAFSGIRFIDRFEIAGGRITLQEVWNDLGELRGR